MCSTVCQRKTALIREHLYHGILQSVFCGSNQSIKFFLVWRLHFELVDLYQIIQLG